MPEVLFRCRQCNFTSSIAALAIVCETQGEPHFEYRKGESFTAKGKQFRIVDRSVGQAPGDKPYPIHIALYKVLVVNGKGKQTIDCSAQELERLLGKDN